MTAYVTAIFFLLGALLGSFTGVLAERIHTGQSFARGRSRCNSCRRELNARDLVPIFSWLAHRGRCRQCGSRVSGLYALYELLLGLAFAGAYLLLGFTPALPVFLAALAVLLFIVIYDLRHTIVPFSASILLIVLCAGYQALRIGIHHSSVPALLHALLTALVIAFFLFCLYAFSRGRAMGLGDTPVVFALSLLAAPYAVAGIFYSFWVGGVIGILILVLRRGGPRMGIEVPFVPFLAVGFLLALLIPWNPLPIPF